MGQLVTMPCSDTQVSDTNAFLHSGTTIVSAASIKYWPASAAAAMLKQIDRPLGRLVQQQFCETHDLAFAGQYDEATLAGMDFALDEASKRGIRLTLVFANYWSHFGGVDQYNIWSFQAGVGERTPLVLPCVLACFGLPAVLFSV